MKNTLTFLLLIICSLGFSQNMTIKYDFPKKIDAGQNYIVNVEIQKNNLNSSGQFQQYIPKGLTVTEIKSADGTFSFSDNMLQISWMKLPIDSLIKLTYQLNADTSIFENFNSNCQFTYIVNNQRGIINTKTKEITVNNKNVIKKIESAIDPKVIKVVRNITLSDKKTVLVKLTVNKKDLVGIGEIIEKIPDNYEVELVSTKIATSNFEFGVLEIKIAKMLKTDKYYEISYKLKKKNEIIEMPTIIGKFKYTDKTKPQAIEITAGKNYGFEDFEDEDEIDSNDNVIENKTNEIKKNDDKEINDFFND